MTVQFYKSLDKEFAIIGIKGRWVRTFLICVGASVGFGVLVGFVLGTGIALIAILVLIVASFFGILVMQARIPSRQLDKAKIASKVPQWVRRRESLGRILTEDSRYVEVKRRLAVMRRAAQPEPEPKVPDTFILPELTEVDINNE